ncbi:unnamed protein product [Gordionus sp. m RMFG-2023]|uniref:uncharacterized protein LOC135926477 n=1 Tax=Gordionus sp. m RMFG-2023 TaxID=3053472 RepID=UPI0030E49CCA
MPKNFANEIKLILILIICHRFLSSPLTAASHLPSLRYNPRDTLSEGISESDSSKTSNKLDKHKEYITNRLKNSNQNMFFNTNSDTRRSTSKRNRRNSLRNREHVTYYKPRFDYNEDKNIYFQYGNNDNDDYEIPEDTLLKRHKLNGKYDTSDIVENLMPNHLKEELYLEDDPSKHSEQRHSLVELNKRGFIVGRNNADCLYSREDLRTLLEMLISAKKSGAVNGMINLCGKMIRAGAVKTDFRFAG